jgi:hypothetical protein
MTIETVERYWAEFLIKARQRFEESLDESLTDCLRLLEDCSDDPRPVIRAWTAMRIRAQGVRRKVGAVWHEQVRPQYEDAHAPERTRCAEGRGEALADWMEIELHRAETALYAQIVRRLLASLEADQPRLCEQCGTRLEPGPVLQARVVVCSRCGTSRQVEPGPAAVLALDLGPYLWRESCWDLWVAKRQAEQFVRRAEDDVTLAQLKAWEQAEIDYLSAWLRERARLLPGSQEVELRRRLEQFYAALEQQTVWRRAGGPRAVASLA